LCACNCCSCCCNSFDVACCHVEWRSVRAALILSLSPVLSDNEGSTGPLRRALKLPLLSTEISPLTFKSHNKGPLLALSLSGSQLQILTASWSLRCLDLFLNTVSVRMQVARRCSMFHATWHDKKARNITPAPARAVSLILQVPNPTHPMVEF